MPELKKDSVRWKSNSVPEFQDLEYSDDHSNQEDLSNSQQGPGLGHKRKASSFSDNPALMSTD